MSEKPWRILVVEDDDAVRSVITRMLHSDGHSVVDATNGIRALRALEAGPVDLVVTDVLMPDMEGLELVRRIRKLPQPPKLIVISGGGRAVGGDYLEIARGLGANGTLSKPLSLADLRSTIDQVMSAG